MGISKSTGARAVIVGQYHTKNDGVASATPFFVTFADRIRTTRVRKDVNPIGRRKHYRIVLGKK